MSSTKTSDATTATAIAFKSEAGRGVLSPLAITRCEELSSVLAEKYRAASANGDRSQLGELAAWAGCLDRLDSFLLQVSRIRLTADKLGRRDFSELGAVALPPGGAISIRAADTCADFESLLFHGRAALDRLSMCVARDHKQSNVMFSRLEAVLTAASPKDPRPRIALDLLEAAGVVKGLLVDLMTEDGTNQKSLRSRVAHYTSVAEQSQVTFTIHRLLDGRYLLLDCEALGDPVLKTSHQLSKAVPFLILGFLDLYLRGTAPLGISELEPAWRNLTAVFSEFLDPNDTGPLLAVVQMHPDGMNYKTRHVRAEIFELAIS